MTNEETLKTLSDELSKGINAIRDQQKVLEDKKLDKELIDKEIRPTIEKVQKAVDQLEVKVTKMATPSYDSKEQAPEHKAFMDFLRKGIGSKDLEVEQKTAYRVRDDTAGGYVTVPPTIAAGILTQITESSPVRQIASVITIGTESYQFMTQTANATANWVGETANAAEANQVTFGIERIPAHEARVFLDITQQLLEDSAVDLEAFFQNELATRFGVLEANAFISGNTTYKPLGILADANIANTAGGDANNVTADGLFTLYFAPKTGYIGNARFLMARATMAFCSKLKDNDAQYLLRRLGESPVWTILGTPVLEAYDMPAMANAAYPVLFGDFRRGYQIVDRVGLQILRDPYSASLAGAVRFHARKRVGGKVVLPEAIYKMKITA